MPSMVQGAEVIAPQPIPLPIAVWDIENVRLPSNCQSNFVVEAVMRYATSEASTMTNGKHDVEPEVFVALNKRSQHRVSDKVLDELINADVTVMWASSQAKGSKTDDVIKRRLRKILRAKFLPAQLRTSESLPSDSYPTIMPFIVLLTSDKDFLPEVQDLRRAGMPVHLVYWKEGLGQDRLLMEAASKHIEWRDLLAKYGGEGISRLEALLFPYTPDSGVQSFPEYSLQPSSQQHHLPPSVDALFQLAPGTPAQSEGSLGAPSESLSTSTPFTGTQISDQSKKQGPKFPARLLGLPKCIRKDREAVETLRKLLYRAEFEETEQTGLRLRVRKSATGRHRGRIYIIVDFVSQEQLDRFKKFVHDLPVKEIFTPEQLKLGITSEKFSVEDQPTKQRTELEQRSQPTAAAQSATPHTSASTASSSIISGPRTESVSSSDIHPLAEQEIAHIVYQSRYPERFNAAALPHNVLQTQARLPGDLSSGKDTLLDSISSFWGSALPDIQEDSEPPEHDRKGKSVRSADPKRGGDQVEKWLAKQPSEPDIQKPSQPQPKNAASASQSAPVTSATSKQQPFTQLPAGTISSDDVQPEVTHQDICQDLSTLLQFGPVRLSRHSDNSANNTTDDLGHSIGLMIAETMQSGGDSQKSLQLSALQVVAELVSATTKMQQAAQFCVEYIVKFSSLEFLPSIRAKSAVVTVYLFICGSMVLADLFGLWLGNYDGYEVVNRLSGFIPQAYFTGVRGCYDK